MATLYHGMKVHAKDKAHMIQEFNDLFVSYLHPEGWTFLPIKGGMNSLCLRNADGSQEYHCRTAGKGKIEVWDSYWHNKRKLVTVLITRSDVIKFVESLLGRKVS